MTCTFDKNVVSNHQAINLSVDIDLTECSGGGVKEIRITVLRKLRIRRQNQAFKHFEYVMFQDKLRGLKASEKYYRPEPYQITLMNVNDKFLPA